MCFLPQRNVYFKSWFLPPQKSICCFNFLFIFDVFFKNFKVFLKSHKCVLPSFVILSSSWKWILSWRKWSMNNFSVSTINSWLMRPFTKIRPGSRSPGVVELVASQNLLFQAKKKKKKMAEKNHSSSLKYATVLDLLLYFLSLHSIDSQSLF